MPIHNRKFLYGVVDGPRGKEMDYLLSEIPKMELRVDRIIRVTDYTKFRPDLISDQVYQTFDYGWLIMDFNDITDPYTELHTGKVLNIPRLDDYFNFFSEASRISRDDRRNR